LDSDKKLSLTPKDAASLTNIVNRLSNQFGYDFMIQNIPTTRTVTPGANAGDPDTITFSDHLNLLESYSPNNIEHARKHASLVWGDKTFTLQDPQILSALTQTDGELNNRNGLTEIGKNAMRDRMHSKFMAFQIMALLSEPARKSIELNKDLYTWKSADGREVEMDGPTIAAMIMARMKPSLKFDMYKEISNAKALTLHSFKYDLTDYFDAMKEIKTLIDEKDKRAYTDDAFIRDILAQLKESPNDSFKRKYELFETEWLLGREVITSQTLMDEAQVHFDTLRECGQWKAEHSSKAQILTLTTQLHAMQTQLTELKNKPQQQQQQSTPTRTTQSNFDEWRLAKDNNDNEFNMIERDGKRWYWCDDHSFNGRPCGMYCLHKPGDGHKKWQERKDARRKKRDKSPADTAPASTSNDNDKKSGDDKKLSLANHLRAALMTQAGVSEDQFQQFWSEACDKSGN
jgi:TolA-binding protein